MFVWVGPYGTVQLLLDYFRKILYWGFIVKVVDRVQVRVKFEKNKTFYVNTHAHLSSPAMTGLRNGNRANCEVRRQAEENFNIEHRS